MSHLDHELNPIMRGDNYSVKVNIKDKDGNPINLEGRTLYMTLKLSPAQPDSEAAFQTKVVLAGSDAQNGEGWVTMLPADTAKLNPIRYWYDIQMVTSETSAKTLLKGRVPVEGDITQTREL